MSQAFDWLSDQGSSGGRVLMIFYLCYKFNMQEYYWRTQVELVRNLRKSIEGLVQIGLSIGLQHVTEVMFSNNILKAEVF